MDIMAKLVSLCDCEAEFDFQRRQAPLEVDGIKMIIQFHSHCFDCANARCGMKMKDLDHYTSKLSTLSKDEFAAALLVPNKDFLTTLSNFVPCVGCKKSVERLFQQLRRSQHPAIEPLVITPHGELSIHHDFLFSSSSLFSLFFIHGTRLRSVVESIPKGKKSKRCNVHSLETHKTRSIGCWIEAWDALSKDCRDRMLVIDMNKLLATVDSYLEKHKFCSECKSKVLQAYHILIGELESSKEAGYCPALYENLRCCTSDKHIHVRNDTDFIAHLIEKAEPEFLESKRDRHAKTLDIAQEEVLTCLGIHIFERLHRIWQKVRSEEQTWLLLFYIGLECLKKSYQAALEEKQGMSNLELLCEELEEKEKRQEEKRELKRQKKKQKKAKAHNSLSTEGPITNNKTVIEEVCKCSTVEPANLTQRQHSGPFGSHMAEHCSDVNNSMMDSTQDCSLRHRPSCADHKQGVPSVCSESAETDSCESCSNQGSVEDSEGSVKDTADKCDCDRVRASPKRIIPHKKPDCTVNNNSTSSNMSFRASDQPSLQELLLENYCWDEDDEDDGFGISEEEILEFRAKQGEVDSKRQELRQHLRERFQELHLSNQIASDK